MRNVVCPAKVRVSVGVARCGILSLLTFSQTTALRSPAMESKGSNPPAEGVINADTFTYADVAPVVDASKHEKTKKPITIASVLHKSKKIANNAVVATKDVASSAVVTLRDVNEKHQVSSTTMAAASSATEKTRSAVSSLWAKVGVEKKKDDPIDGVTYTVLG
jgi:hypothetical protein